MPIKKENYHLYPGGSPNSKEWKIIRELVLERAGGVFGPTCECTGQCGQEHQDGFGYDDRCGAPNGGRNRRGSKIVLTIAHLDQDPTNNSPKNLRAMCQMCHNRLDAPHRAKNRRKRR